MSPETTTALVALVIALLALFVTSAQAVQQYAATAHLMRKCDSIVVGPMPGGARRVWSMRQFRFRVLYTIPQISIPAHLWPSRGQHVPSSSRATVVLPSIQSSTRLTSAWVVSPAGLLTKHGNEASSHGGLKWATSFMKLLVSQVRAIRATRRETRRAYKYSPGEASWVTFFRQAQRTAGKFLVYEMLEGDADRCPSDLPVMPMQVSLRDIIVLGLVSDMEITSASFTNKTLAMQGSPGSITSTMHPILGPLIHFANRQNDNWHPLSYDGSSISQLWMSRLWRVCPVAGSFLQCAQKKTCRRH